MKPKRYAPTFSGQRALQDASEFAWFLHIVQTEKVRSYAEIGSRRGDTFHEVVKAMPKESTAVAVDLASSPSRHELEKAVTDLRMKGYNASCLFGDSTAPATVAQVHGRGPYDLIFIDGHHKFEIAAADWRNYRNMARIVAFHDIDGAGEKNSDGTPVDVPLLWASIRAQEDYTTAECITPGSKMGIGVVWIR